MAGRAWLAQHVGPSNLRTPNPRLLRSRTGDRPAADRVQDSRG
ncbi:hypothetical protein QJS66_17140 [Kocuria rhizophila]|nr:hypothetical protein QJS66_17140 [Kocuria rhizophila]